MESDEFVVEHLLFCVCGSIAAAGVPAVIQSISERRLAQSIHIVLSPSARHFVGEHTLAALTGNQCILDPYEDVRLGRPTHVQLAKQCAAAIVAPATASTIAKLALGITDTVITMVLGVFSGPTLLVPALHPSLYRKAAVVRNIERAKSDGYFVYGPVTGYSLSERERRNEAGAMPEAALVVACLEHLVRCGTLPSSVGSGEPSQ